MVVQRRFEEQVWVVALECLRNGVMSLSARTITRLPPLFGGGCSRSALTGCRVGGADGPRLGRADFEARKENK